MVVLMMSVGKVMMAMRDRLMPMAMRMARSRSEAP
jgi:hypothetical protein